MHSDYGIVWSCCVFSLKSISWNCQGPCRSNDSEDQARQKYKHPSKLRHQQSCLGHSHLRESWSAKRLTTLLLFASICNNSVSHRVEEKHGKSLLQALKYLKKGRYAHETVLFSLIFYAIFETTKLRACLTTFARAGSNRIYGCKVYTNRHCLLRETDQKNIRDQNKTKRSKNQ